MLLSFDGVYFGSMISPACPLNVRKASEKRPQIGIWLIFSWGSLSIESVSGCLLAHTTTYIDTSKVGEIASRTEHYRMASDHVILFSHGRSPCDTDVTEKPPFQLGNGHILVWNFAQFENVGPKTRSN